MDAGCDIVPQRAPARVRYKVHVRSMKLVVMLAAAAASACSGSADSTESVAFGGAPLVTATGSAGNLTVEVRTSPSPPARGAISVQYVVRDARTAMALDGLAVTVKPFMPAMGHGASVLPTVEAQGAGVYVVHQVELFMPGYWELRTALRGAGSDDVAPAFDVP